MQVIEILGLPGQNGQWCTSRILEQSPSFLYSLPATVSNFLLTSSLDRSHTTRYGRLLSIG